MFISLPQPNSVELTGDNCHLANFTLIYLTKEATPLDFEAAKLLQQEFLRTCQRRLPICCSWRPPQQHGVIALGNSAGLATYFADTPDPDSHDEAYGISINQHDILLCAENDRGRLWAVQTLRQLLRQYRQSLPGMRVKDAPSMKYRGVMLDVARRKVPTIATLKELVDTLSMLKINMLQLQVEHTFQWHRHPHIGENCGSLSCEDIIALNAHCNLRGIELVPMLQSFGHMRNILMLKEYRHLAENEKIQWSLNPTDPASLQFLDELYEEYLPCFSSNKVNVGSDETFDLGKDGGKSNDTIARIGQGAVYVNHLLGLHKLLSEKYHKQMMCWGDVVLSHPEFIPQLPEDMILLNWWYNPDPDFPQAVKFAENGRQQIICPGTNTWGQIFPRVNWAWINVENFLRDGKAAGALGMLHTDWGDRGHYNLLGCSYYSYAHAAAASWMETPLARDQFERLAGNIIFGGTLGNQVVDCIHQLGDGEATAVWDMGGMTSTMLFSSPFEGDERFANLRNAPLLPSAEDAKVAARIFSQSLSDSYEPAALADLAWAAKALAYAKIKTAWAFSLQQIAEGEGDIDLLLAQAKLLLAEYPVLLAEFIDRWKSGNHTSEIDVSLAQFDHGFKGTQLLHDWLQSNYQQLKNGEQIAPPEIVKFIFPWKENMDTLWQEEVEE